MFKKIILFLLVFILTFFLSTNSSFIGSSSFLFGKSPDKTDKPSDSSKPPEKDNDLNEMLEDMYDSLDVEGEGVLEDLANKLNQFSEQIPGDREDLEELRRIIWLKIILLTDKDLFQRARAATILGSFHNEIAVMALVISLRHDFHFYVRESSAKALGEIGSRKATLHIIKAICRDEAKEVINHAINSLGFIRDIRALDTLIYILTGNEPGKGKHPHFPFKGNKCNALDYYDLIALSNAAIALGRIQDKGATPALVQALNHKSYIIRLSAAQALSLIRDPDSLGPLEERLEVETNMMVKSAIENAIFQFPD